MEEDETTGVIYCITNMINNKKYVGQALSYIYKKGKIVKHGMEGRFNVHREDAQNGSESCPKLYNAMRKYGIDNFKVELIKICPAENLFDEESSKILEYDAIKEGYNIVALNSTTIGQMKSKNNRLSRIDKIRSTMKDKWANNKQYIETTTNANLMAVKKRAVEGTTKKINKHLPNNIYKNEDGYDIRIMRNGEHKITSVTSKTKSDDELLKEAISIRDKLMVDMENGIVVRHDKKKDHNGSDLPDCISSFSARGSFGYKVVLRRGDKRIDKIFVDSKLSMDDKLQKAKDTLQILLDNVNKNNVIIKMDDPQVQT